MVLLFVSHDTHREAGPGCCSLVCNDIEHIANALSEMTNLTNLYLSGNSSLGGSANVWSRYLCHMIHIKVLHLGGCSLVCNDIEHIANALSEMTNLTNLSLWRQLILRRVCQCVVSLFVSHEAPARCWTWVVAHWIAMMRSLLLSP